MTTFQFYTKLDLTILLGRKARNTRDLAAGLREVPRMSVYYHTHRFLQQHHYLSPEPPNDFAYWSTNVLNDDLLGERLASIDTIQYTTIEDIRGALLGVLDEHLAGAEHLSDAPPGQEFHFVACQTFALPTPHSASTLREFHDALGRISIHSLYFHMFDARLRPLLGQDDFSIWLRDNGQQELADRIAGLDPYTHTLDGLRRTLQNLVRTYEQD